MESGLVTEIFNVDLKITAIPKSNSFVLPHLFLLLRYFQSFAQTTCLSQSCFTYQYTISCFIRSRNFFIFIQKPWKPKDKWPKEAAEVNYLVGLCSLELRNYLQAHDAFNNAIEIDKKYAQAYYQRGTFIIWRHPGPSKILGNKVEP